jgi:hypothetical protein
MHPDMSTVGAYFTPARIITRILTSVVGTLMMPLWLTPPAAIYARLAGTAGYRGADGAPIQDVFG